MQLQFGWWQQLLQPPEAKLAPEGPTLDLALLITWCNQVNLGMAPALQLSWSGAQKRTFSLVE